MSKQAQSTYQSNKVVAASNCTRSIAARNIIRTVGGGDKRGQC